MTPLLLVWLIGGLCGLQDPQKWTLEPELRIGSVDDPVYGLNHVGRITFGPDGSVWVSQVVENEIRVFTREGRYVRTIGRAGDGPGEFRGMSALAWFADTLVVMDADLRRFTLFDTAGNVLGTRPWESPALDAPLARSGPLAFLSNGTGVVVPGYGFRPDREDVPTRIPVLRADASGAVLDTLGWRNPVQARMVMKGPRGSVLTVPFAATELVKVSQAGRRIWIVDFQERPGQPDDIVRITAFDADGAKRVEREFPYPRMPIPRKARDSASAAIIAHLRDGLGMSGRAAERMARETFPVPKSYPAMDAAFAGEDGSLWLSRMPNPDGTRTWDVYDADGNRIARLEAPPRLTIKWVEDSTLWGVQSDELDVQYVVRYRIRRSR